MSRVTVYTAIDLGSTKVATVVARVGGEGELQVLGMGIAPAQGVQKGMVVDIAEAQEAVRASVEEAQRYLGRGVSWAYVSATGAHITSMNRVGALQGVNSVEGLSPTTVQEVIQTSYPEVDPGKEVLHIIPGNYVVDGLRGIRNPLGLNAESVEVEANVVIGEAAPLRNVTRAVEAVGVHPRALVAGALASAEAVLTEDEREMGVVMVDMGGGTADIAIFLGGNLRHTSVIPVGGYQVTRDIGYKLHVPFFFAEELKLKYGNAMPELVEEEEVQLPKFQGGEKRAISSRDVAAPIHERVKEVLRLVALRVHEAGFKRIPPGGLVLTGGASVLPGLREMVDELFGVPVRVGAPRNIAGLPPEIRTPAFATTVGILLWGIKHEGEGRSYSEGERTLHGFRGLFRRRHPSGAAPEQVG